MEAQTETLKRLTVTLELNQTTLKVDSMTSFQLLKLNSSLPPYFAAPYSSLMSSNFTNLSTLSYSHSSSSPPPISSSLLSNQSSPFLNEALLPRKFFSESSNPIRKTPEDFKPPSLMNTLLNDSSQTSSVLIKTENNSLFDKAEKEKSASPKSLLLKNPALKVQSKKMETDISISEDAKTPSSCSSSSPTLKGNKPRNSRRFIHKCSHEGCGRAFRRKEHLKRHLLIHTGERPFRCEVPSCNKSFSRIDNLSQHMKMHEKKGKTTPGVHGTTNSNQTSSPPSSSASHVQIQIQQIQLTLNDQNNPLSPRNQKNGNLIQENVK